MKRVFSMLMFLGVMTSTIFGSPISTKDFNSTESKLKSKWDMIEAFNAFAIVNNFNGSWISENEITYNSIDGDYRIFNVETLKDYLFMNKSEIENLWPNAKLTILPGKKKILVRYDAESLFRYSVVARYSIFDMETKTVTPIAQNERLQYCSFSPSGDRLVYVLGNNVFIRQPNNKEYKITDDGKIGVIYNGITDWVYEEEVFKKGSALWWSKDGEKLVMGHFNDIDVKTYQYFIYKSDSLNNQYPEEVDLKYPKAGTENPQVILKLTNVKDIQSDLSAKWIDLKAPVDVVSKDHVLDKVIWSGNDKILVFWMNRRQNKGIFVLCNLNGICDKVLNIEEPNGWLMPSDIDCMDSNHSCLMINWIDNWLQVWKLDLKSGENQWKSLGNFTILNIYGYNNKTDELFYQGTLENDINQHHVFKNKECLSCKLKDSDGINCKQANAQFSKKFKFYAITCLGPTPMYTKIIETNSGKEIFDWENNQMFRDYIKTKLMPTLKYIKVPIDNGFEANVKLYLPPSLEWDNPKEGKKYPLIVDVYGGPNSVRITNTLKVGWPIYMVTEHNVIYAEIETRGSGNKGKEILMSINNHFGSYEVDDQIKAVKYLHKNYSNIFDNERTGIWGWSYGGFVTARALAKDKDRVFQCGISVAPVTSWSLYDSIYTERYMGLPTNDDNIKNYEETDLSKNLENFKIHDFLLVHGVADDNVHVQNSMLLSRALQDADIHFEEMFYPDENHSIGNLQPHLYHTMEQFWINCLNLNTDDDE